MDKVIRDFEGAKYQLENLPGHKICITAYEKFESTKHAGGFYYKIQFVMKQSTESKPILCFMTTGASQIVKVLDKKPSVPFYRTIYKVGRSYSFLEDTASLEEATDAIIQDLNIDINQL